MPERVYTEMVEFQPPRLEVTSLEALGMTTSRDTLSLASNNLRLIHFDDPSLGPVYFAGLDHPFIGQHLADFLNVFAPYKGTLTGMQADLRMPVEAEKEGRPVRLHSAHLGDERIGRIYRNYVQNHAHAWLNAAENKQGDISSMLNRIKFVDTDIYIRAIAHVIQKDSSFDFISMENVVITAVQVGKKGDFGHFLQQRGVNFDGEDLKRLKTGYRTFSELVPHARLFLQTLSSKEQKEAALFFATRRHELLIDPVAKKYYGRGYWSRDIWTRFIKGGLVTVMGASDTDWSGLQATIEPQELDVTSGVYSRQVRHIHFPRSVQREGLYPALVWKIGKKGPELLDQTEFQQVLKRAGAGFQKHWDILLGIALLAYFSPDITDTWSREMTLEAYPKIKQPMMVAQMALWPSIGENLEQLTQNSPFFEKCQEAFDQ